MRKKVIAVAALFALRSRGRLRAGRAGQHLQGHRRRRPRRRPAARSKPVPVSRSSSTTTVGEQSNNRPVAVKKYSIRFAGLNRVNTNAFAVLRRRTLENKGPSGCPDESIVGTGFIENATGATNNPADRSIECNAALRVFNSGNNNARRSTSPAARTRPIRRGAARSSWRRRSPRTSSRLGRRIALEFNVPQPPHRTRQPGDRATLWCSVNVDDQAAPASAATGFFESRRRLRPASAACA